MSSLITCVAAIIARQVLSVAACIRVSCCLPDRAKV